MRYEKAGNPILIDSRRSVKNIYFIPILNKFRKMQGQKKQTKTVAKTGFYRRHNFHYRFHNFRHHRIWFCKSQDRRRTIGTDCQRGKNGAIQRISPYPAKKLDHRRRSRKLYCRFEKWIPRKTRLGIPTVAQHFFTFYHWIRFFPRLGDALLTFFTSSTKHKSHASTAWKIFFHHTLRFRCNSSFFGSLFSKFLVRNNSYRIDNRTDNGK